MNDVPVRGVDNICMLQAHMPAKLRSSIGGNKNLVPVRFRLKFDESRRNSTNFRRYVVVDQTS